MAKIIKYKGEKYVRCDELDDKSIREVIDLRRTAEEKGEKLSDEARRIRNYKEKINFYPNDEKEYQKTKKDIETYMKNIDKAINSLKTIK